MKKEIAAASVITAFLASASPSMASLPPPGYKDKTYSPAREACLKPFETIYYRGKNYLSDGVAVAVTDGTPGSLVFISNLVKDAYSCEAMR